MSGDDAFQSPLPSGERVRVRGWPVRPLPSPQPSPQEGEGARPGQTIDVVLGSEILAQPQRVIDRRVGVALGHAVADAEQQITVARLG